MRSVLVTRPQPVAGELADQLRREGFEVYLAPLSEYVEVYAEFSDLAAYQALVFTSAQAATFFAGRSQERALPVFAVGDATAESARQFGFTAVCSAHGDSHDVMKLIQSKKDALHLKKILHVCAADTVQDLGRPLAKEGIIVDSVPVYEARLLEALPQDVAAALRDKKITTVTLFSARTAANFARLLQEKTLQGASAGLEAVCISDRVAGELKGLPWRRLRVARHPHLESMLEILRSKEGKHVMTDDQNSADSRRKGADRRQRHGGDYAGADRRTGLDRRAYNEQQRHRVREEKWGFLGRSVLMGSFFAIAILYVGAFLLAPEFLQLKKEAARVQQMEDKVQTMNQRLQQLQEKQGGIGGTLNRKIEEAQDAAAPVTAAVSDAFQQTDVYQGLQQFLDIFANIREMSGTVDGRKSVAEVMDRLKTVLAAAPSADVSALNPLLSSLKEKDPAMDKVMGRVGAKDLGAAALLLTLNEFRSDVDSQQPFDSDLAVVRKFAGSDPEMQKAIDSLAPYAKKGILSRQALQEEFKGLAADIVTAKLQGEDLTVKEHILKRFDKLVKVRRVDDIEGQSVDAVVARAQLMLDRGDVNGALQELQSLQGAPADVAAPWMNKAAGAVIATESSDILMQSVLQQVSQQTGFSLQGLFSSLRPANQAVPYLSPALQGR